MARASTASFICEVALQATPADERELLIRLDCARMVYNACLGESLRRLKQLKESRAYKAACLLPKGIRGSEAAQKRTKAFREADEQVGVFESMTCTPTLNNSGRRGWASIGWTA